MKFEDFEKILKKTIREFKDIEKFGYLGIMGSQNTERDIDMIRELRFSSIHLVKFSKWSRIFIKRKSKKRTTKKTGKQTKRKR